MNEVLAMCTVICLCLVAVIAIVAVTILAIIKNCRENNPTKCSLCDTTDIGCYLIFKVKKRWYSWGETGLDKQTICICENCQRRLRNAANAERKRREKEEED